MEPFAGSTTLARMEALATEWERTADGRRTFLACYRLMTSSTVGAVGGLGFADAAWVDQLLERFAAYYFDALEAYDQEPSTAPAVWRVAHDSCREPGRWELQRLLLGISAHINRDLPLTVAELLEPEWATLSDAAREHRRQDYYAVNDIIGATVDAVQDTVLEVAVPELRIVDVILGRTEEFLLSRLLYRWRDRAWDNALALVAAPDALARDVVVSHVETDALRISDAILLTHGTSVFALLGEDLA